MEIDKIYEGWRNNLFPPEELRELIKNISLQRMEICNSCGNISTKHFSLRPDIHCMVCGCTLSALTKCLSCQCRDKKWFPVVTQEQEEEMANEDK